MLRKKLGSLKIKFPIITFFTYMILIVVILLACYFRFSKNMTDTYRTIGREVLALGADSIVIDHIPDYLSGSYDEMEYHHTQEKLNRIAEACSEVYYLYAYQIPAEGSTATVIFDTDTGHIEADELGDPYEMEPGLVQVIGKLRQGQELDPVTDNTKWGYLMTCAKPLIDSSGVCQGYLFVDFNLTDIRSENGSFIRDLFFIVFLLMLVVLYFGMRAVAVRITTPIEKMYLCLSGFRYSSDEDRKENIRKLKALDIHTNPEIQSLYESLISSTEDSYTYLHEYEKATEELDVVREKAMTDELTGFGNKAAFMEKAEVYQEKVRSGEAVELAVIIADINNLKYVNDTFGHKRGDEYILGCCGIIKGICRESTVYRMGGDEFLILLENRDYMARKQIFQKLEKRFRDSYADKSRDEWMRYSAAIGMAEYQGEKDIADMCKRADVQMYEAKEEFKKKYGSYR